MDSYHALRAQRAVKDRHARTARILQGAAMLRSRPTLKGPVSETDTVTSEVLVHGRTLGAGRLEGAQFRGLFRPR